VRLAVVAAPGALLTPAGRRANYCPAHADRIMISSLCLSMIFSENRFPLFRIML
jgi:hypothetical protein